jgi:hypothetical protein
MLYVTIVKSYPVKEGKHTFQKEKHKSLMTLIRQENGNNGG